MKSEAALQNSYQTQKEIFETAKSKRISNRQKQIADLDRKISHLSSLREKLLLANTSEREFESFESFRQKAIANNRKSLSEAKETS